MAALSIEQRRRRFPPWVTRAEHEAHLRDDRQVHSDTTTSLTTILNEVRKGNEDTAALRSAFAPLEPISKDIVKSIADRKFRRQLGDWIVWLAKGVGWCGAFIGAVAAVASVSPGFLGWLKWIL